jgi:hypothetical protein
MKKERTELDSELLTELREVARQEDRGEGEVLEEAVKLFLNLRNQFVHGYPYVGRGAREIIATPSRFRSPGSLRKYFEEAARWQEENGVEPLSDEEAMELANEELHAMRRERAERGKASK